MRFLDEKPGVVLLALTALMIFLPMDSIVLGILKVFLLIAWFAVLGLFLATLWKRPKGPRADKAGSHALADLRARFPFCTPQSAVFGARGLTIEFTTDSPEITWSRLRPLRADSAEDWERALFVIQRAALFEAQRRGFKITDDTNDFIAPEVTPHGFLIEEHENEDGSVDAIVAADVLEPVSRQDYDFAAKQLRLIGRYTNWNRTMAQPWRGRSFGDGYVPLYRPVLKTVRLVDAPSNENPFRPRSTEKGAAQWAWVDEMRASPMIGYLPGQDADWSARFDAPGAPLGGFFKRNWGDWPEDDYAEIFMRGEGHRIVVGPPGSGKFTAAFAPLLLMTDNASAVVLDVASGEAARITAPWRATLGPVLVIDPFGVSGLESGSLNPLDFLRADDPDILQAAKRLTDALFIVQSGSSNDEYYNDQARDVLTAYLLHVATDFSEKNRRTLQRVRELIRRPLTDDVLAAMQDNPIAGGVVRDTAANLVAAMKADAERNTFYVTQTLRANTAFLDLPAVQKATEKTSFDPRELRRQVSTLYVCLPESQLAPVGRWLRLVYATIMEQVREKGAVPLHVLIDEFPALGRFSRVKDDMALVRKFGIHIHIATQSLTQLEGIYGPEWQSFMAAARYQQLLGANDQMTAEYFSAGLGRTTRRSTSTSQSRSTGGGSQSESAGWEAADLMSPDELRRMPPETTIVIVEGMNPLTLIKHHYFAGGLLDGRLANEAGADAAAE